MPGDDEDLIREATALTERIEVCIGQGENWLWGRRRNGSVSVFCGPLVFQFNSANEIRRAFADGRRIKSENGQLIRLERTSGGGAIHFIESVLDQSQQETLLAKARQSLDNLAAALDKTGNPVRGEGADLSELASAAKQWLAEVLASPLAIADQPHAT